MKQNEIIVKCICGVYLRVLEARLKSGSVMCPECKQVLDSTHLETSETSTADTQTINIQEMARMAQEGIDVEISGEWNTADPSEATKDRNKKD